ncbi:MULTISPECIES: hypothetical protein [Haloferax]|uniref:DUF7964 domain-containing protein n=1 Tax=Haloferax marinum TaxID=2666143 RepID=A0A6A8GBP1_9EURY|nr:MULTISPECIES: hypothetical protein [Haloferax]KAB1191202.1 hypothetical protein Hfx1150_16115 [Haloferax sp. CBA1150]MRW98092.1 hypothetical protein [Haloferax marinum]
MSEKLVESLPPTAVPESFVDELEAQEAVQQAIAVRGYHLERDGETIPHAYQLVVNVRGKYILGLHLTNGEWRIVFDTRDHPELAQEGARAGYNAVHDALYERAPSDAEIDFEATPEFWHAPQ